MNSEDGFSLIELLTVTAIIGVLLAVAFPIYGDYRRRSNDRVAQSTLRNTTTALETYFVDNHEYATCNQTNCGDLLPGLHGVDLRVELSVEGDKDSFQATARHVNGSGRLFHRESQ